MAKREKKKQRPRREVVLIIVEGESDKLALEGPLEKFTDDNGIDIKIKFACESKNKDKEEITGGDLTSDRTINTNNYDAEVTNRVIISFQEKSKYYTKEIARVYQLIDTDGTFIKQENILEDISLTNVQYNEENITCNNAYNIIKRNEHKSRMVDYLIHKDTIKLDSNSVGYSAYYFSCNLDHYTANDRNMNPKNKKIYAMDFCDKCIDDDSFFKMQLVDGEYTARDMNYNESWEYIKRDKNSLSRMTNINILLADLKEWYFNRKAQNKPNDEE